MNVLRDRIETARDESGKTLGQYTVLSSKRDPYRLDTPANHRKAKWLLDSYNEVHDEGRIHLRGLHYKLVGRVNKPDGTPYVNDDKTWVWMSEEVAKAARFLGYLPWDAIRDARNSPPQIFTQYFDSPRWVLGTGRVEVELPDRLDPHFFLAGDLCRQPWQQIVIAEKQGVEDLLLPVCQMYRATLCLPTGELSDTMLYDLLRDAQEDGRPVAIHQLGDFDPSGWQMAISTGRTVQALVDTQFPDLHARVHAIGMTREQCERWDLPSSPLKKSELRGTAWKAAMGREQTELDAAVALKPKQFADMVADSLDRYVDWGVEARAEKMKSELVTEANARLADQLGTTELHAIREEAATRLDSLTELADEINNALHVDPESVGIEVPDMPGVLIGDAAEDVPPLVDTAWEWRENTTLLKSRKAYEGVGK